MLISLFADERTLTALLCTGPAIGNFRKKRQPQLATSGRN